MRNSTSLTSIIICLCGLSTFACSDEKSKGDLVVQNHAEFNPNALIVKEDGTAKKVRGQVLYLPVYSNIPYMESGRKYSLSAFVAIHNTDLTNRMTITKVLFFDNDGKPVANYLERDTIIQPLGSTNFFIPENDKSGTGANFIVEIKNFKVWQRNQILQEAGHQVDRFRQQVDGHFTARAQYTGFLDYRDQLTHLFPRKLLSKDTGEFLFVKVQHQPAGTVIASG